jgi:hypothetical protein
MKELVSGCTQSHALILIALLACVGCQAPYPMPLPPPVPQPISPISQPVSPIYPPISPIAQPTPQPISPPILPISQPGTPPISQPTSLISLSGTPTQQATIRAALARCTFPFDRLKPGLQRAGISSVTVSWRPMGNGSLGWASTDGQVAINNTISGLQAQRTAIMELGHAVDFFYLTPDMRKAIIRLWHPELPDNDEWFGSTDYWSQVGEAYSTLFLWAFTDEEMWFDAGYSHKPSKELAVQLRAILLPETAIRRR